MPSLLGIDNGLTVTKAVIFDVDGRQLAVARRKITQLMPQARYFERDMAEVWQATAEAVQQAIKLSGRPASDIKAVAATAHGDGIYLLNEHQQPLGAGILSLDSRAEDIISEWKENGVFDHLLSETGQQPHLSAPSTLLAWIKKHQPDRFQKISHILSCKDWLRYCLTDEIGTDRTDASASFVNVNSQNYSAQIMQFLGLESLFSALPPIAHSAEIAGYITASAAANTGLIEGTPVAYGLHDVTSSALGIDGHKVGSISVVAGTYSINETVSDKPQVSEKWFCRNAIEVGQWNNMAISPASNANYDWFLDTLCQAEQIEAQKHDKSIHEIVAKEIAAALKRPSTILFHPYLFGSPHGGTVSGSFMGLHGWHERGDMLKAVLEGIIFNHRTHIEALKANFEHHEVRLTGGASRNPIFAQMFADSLNMPVTVTNIDEAAALGAALCAGSAIGVYESPQQGAEKIAGDEQIYLPNADRHHILNQRFVLYNDIAETLKSHWPKIEQLAQQESEMIL